VNVHPCSSAPLLNDEVLINQQQVLAEQLDGHAIPLAQAFELLWQGKLGGHSSDYLQLQQAVLRLDRTALLDAVRRLIHAEGGRRYLASGACDSSGAGGATCNVSQQRWSCWQSA
jgi:hypothetical protein